MSHEDWLMIHFDLFTAFPAWYYWINEYYFYRHMFDTEDHIWCFIMKKHEYSLALYLQYALNIVFIFVMYLKYRKIRAAWIWTKRILDTAYEKNLSDWKITLLSSVSIQRRKNEKNYSLFAFFIALFIWHFIQLYWNNQCFQSSHENIFNKIRWISTVWCFHIFKMRKNKFKIRLF